MNNLFITLFVGLFVIINIVETVLILFVDKNWKKIFKDEEK